MKNIWIFLGIAFTLTWGLAFWLISNGGMANPYATFIFIAFMLIPAISVFITKLITKEGWRDIGFKPRFRGHIRWYIVAWLGIPFLIALGGVLYFVIFPGEFDPNMTALVNSNQNQVLQAGGSISDEAMRLAILGNLVIAVLIAPILNIITCFGEELGWRGYLLPQLLSHMSVKKSLLYSGIIWGLWHAPMIAMGHNYGVGYTGAPWGGIVAMCGFCFVIGCIFSFVTIKTGSFWPAVVAHGALNGFAAASLCFSNNIAPNPFVGPLPTGFIGGAFLIVFGLICFFFLRLPNAGTEKYELIDEDSETIGLTVMQKRNTHGKKLIAPIIITLLVMMQLGAMIWIIFVLDMNKIISTVICGAILVFIGICLYNLFERIKEIRSGEEDDLSNY